MEFWSKFLWVEFLGFSLKASNPPPFWGDEKMIESKI